MVEERFAIGGPDVVAPHSFDFQLRHYVIAPEVREGDTLVEIFRLASDRLVKVEVTARGSVEHPVLQLCDQAPEATDERDRRRAHAPRSWSGRRPAAQHAPRVGSVQSSLAGSALAVLKVDDRVLAQRQAARLHHRVGASLAVARAA